MRIWPAALVSLRLIIRAFLSRLLLYKIDRRGFSQERMTYIPEESKVIHQSKDGKEEKVFEPLEWLAAMPATAKRSEDGCSHMPNKGEQMVRYYGYYSNVSRAKRKKQDLDDIIPSVLGPEGSSVALIPAS